MRVGLTGGIASGKSTVSAILAELGAVVIDADRLAREVVAKGTPGLAQVVEAFGPEVLTPDGEMDRAKVGEIVFNDEAKRKVLEGIVHPLVFERYAELEASAPDGRRGHPRHPAAGRVRAGRHLRRGDRGRRAGRDPDRADGPGPRAGPARTPSPGSRLRRPGSSGARSRRTSSRTPGRAKTSAQVAVARGPDREQPAVRKLSRQAARSGSPRRRSFCSASRSSWRTRSAEMPCFGADVGQLVLAAVDQAVARPDDVGGALVELADQGVQPVAGLDVEHGEVRARARSPGPSGRPARCRRPRRRGSRG